jgi:hypothetical protein
MTIRSKIQRFMRKVRLPLVAVLVGLLGVSAQAQRAESPAQGPREENAIANFAALDKVTAAVKQLPIELNKTVEFRTLKITPRVCYTSSPKDPPKTSTFVEVNEVLFDGKEKRIFTGWMFAESPGLNPLVHPVFDVWLTGCSQPRTTPDAAAPPSADATKQPRKRPPR